MSNIVVIGTQWGDEGKGKIVDYLASQANAVVRFQGGNNAGHTIIANNVKNVFHLIPSGILHENSICILGSGMVINPEVFCQEITTLQENGVNISPDRLKVSDRAHLIFPFQRNLDIWREEYAIGKNKIGTTKRGIGPCYEDKIARRGIMTGDLLHPESFKQSLEDVVNHYNKFYCSYYDEEPYKVESFFRHFTRYTEIMLPYIQNTTLTVHELIKNKKNVLFEGAQGTLLDVDHGTYPYVTSSNTVAANACIGSGVGPKHIDKVIGITKAYTTRVGEGPFPTELFDTAGEFLQKQGHEYGATTGRPRRCGYLDLVALKHACMINGVTSLIITKLDVLSGLKTIKLATKYRHKNDTFNHFPSGLRILKDCQPLYQDMTGWDDDITKAREISDLPKACQQYIKFIENFVEVPVNFLSVGPDRNANIELDNLW